MFLTTSKEVNTDREKINKGINLLEFGQSSTLSSRRDKPVNLLLN